MKEFFLENPSVVFGSNVLTALLLVALSLLRGWIDTVHATKGADKDLAVSILQDAFGETLRQHSEGYDKGESNRSLWVKEKEGKVLQRSVRFTKMISRIDTSYKCLQLSVKAAFLLSWLAIAAYLGMIAEALIGENEPRQVALLYAAIITSSTVIALCIIAAISEFYFLGAITRAKQLGVPVLQDKVDEAESSSCD